MGKTKLIHKIFTLFLMLFFIPLFGGNTFVKGSIEGGNLKLQFAQPLKNTGFFSIPNKDSTRFVYSIKGGVLPNGRGISHLSYDGIESFRIGQFSGDLLRVVIVSKRKLQASKISSNTMIIPLNGAMVSNSTSSSSSNNTTTTQNRDNAKVVVIDAGHGGKDSGAVGNGLLEKNIVLKVASKLQATLEDRGYKVYMTRSSDSFIKLPNRTEFANKKKADFFVSLHLNASPAKKWDEQLKGLEVFYLSPARTQREKEAAAKENSVVLEGKDRYIKNEFLSLLRREKIVESHKLSIDISNMIVANTREHYGKISDGSVRTADFWVLVGAQMPAVLVELGYITNKTDASRLQDAYYQKLLAKSLADGIGRYLKNHH